MVNICVKKTKISYINILFNLLFNGFLCFKINKRQYNSIDL